MTMPVYASGMYINDDGNLVIDADEAAAAGVRSIEFIKGEPPITVAKPEEQLEAERKLTDGFRKRLQECGKRNIEVERWLAEERRAVNQLDEHLVERDARITELESQVASWKDAHERAAVIAAEEADRQTAELRKQLAEARNVINRCAAQVGHPPIAPGEPGIESVAEAVERRAAHARKREEALDSITPQNLRAFAASEAHHEEHHEREKELEAQLAEANEARRTLADALEISITQREQAVDLQVELRDNWKQAEARAADLAERHKKATRLVAKYRPILEVYAKEENWFRCDSTSEGGPKTDFLVYRDGRDISGYEFAQAALNPEARQALDNSAAELCARLREHFESAHNPACPDPECNYAGRAYPVHEADCAYVKYVAALNPDKREEGEKE